MQFQVDTTRTAARLNTTGQMSGHIAIGDLDGDGDLDAFASGLDNQVMRRVPPERYTSESQPIGASPLGRRGVMLLDVDNDGDLDAFLSPIGGTPNDVRLAINDGNAAFTDLVLPAALGDRSRAGRSDR